MLAIVLSYCAGATRSNITFVLISVVEPCMYEFASIEVARNLTFTFAVSVTFTKTLEHADPPLTSPELAEIINITSVKVELSVVTEIAGAKLSLPSSR
jgi:hypothetical protein